MSSTDLQIIQNKIYDFMFELSENECNFLKDSLRSQFVTSNEPTKGGSRYMPFAFTEQGFITRASKQSLQ
jgi:hypothetical protein